MSTATALTPTELHRTWVAIERNGGGFCQKLASAWFAGDERNRARLNETFAHLITEHGPGSVWYIDRAL